MTNVVTIRRAGPDDVETVAWLWNEAAQWLKERGLDQWQYPVRTHAIEAAVSAGNCWLVHNNTGQPIATVTLDDDADPRLWKPYEDPDQAFYVHRLVVRQTARQHELGSAVLDWASQRAKSAHKRWLRLDAWTSNRDLHQYYLGRGFTHVRTVAAPDIVSGALFQRPAGVVWGRGPQVLDSTEVAPE